jgi:hypothetical protein
MGQGAVKSSKFSVHRENRRYSVYSPCLCVSVVNEGKQLKRVKNSQFEVHRKTGAPPCPSVYSPCLCVSVVNKGKAVKKS